VIRYEKEIMRMTITAIILFVSIGLAMGYAVCSVQAQARSLRQCKSYRIVDAAATDDDERIEPLYGDGEPATPDRSAHADKAIPPRVVRVIRAAAEAADRLAAIEADRAGVAGLIDGPRVWVDLDAISRIESGDNDAALGGAGERGRYQITEGAWNDTMEWLRQNRGWRVRWNFRADAHDPQKARVVAGMYINEVLPRWLACRRLDKHDSTGPVPDCLIARVAAYNCGARRVRQAYARWQADAGTSKHWIAWLPASTQNYLAAYAVASGFAAASDVARDAK